MKRINWLVTLIVAAMLMLLIGCEPGDNNDENRQEIKAGDSEERMAEKLSNESMELPSGENYQESEGINIALVERRGLTVTVVKKGTVEAWYSDDNKDEIAGYIVSVIYKAEETEVTDGYILQGEARGTTSQAVAPKQRALITLDSYPTESLMGVVLSVEQQREMVTDHLANTLGVQCIKVSIDDIPDYVRISEGMGVEVEIIIERLEDVLCVPVESVFDNWGNKGCYIIKEDGSKMIRQVQTGISNGRFIEIKQGLEEGEKVFWLEHRAEENAYEFNIDDIPWTKEAEIETSDGYIYSFMNFSFLQAQVLKLVRAKDRDADESEQEILGETNGDSPRSWATVIRPAGAPEDNYGQLYLNAQGLIVGIRSDYDCYFAYDTHKEIYYGHGDIEDLSPFVLIEAETQMNEPDVTALILEVAKDNFLYMEYMEQYEQNTGRPYERSYDPEPNTLKEGLKHPNKEVKQLSRWLIEMQEKGLSVSSDMIHEIIDYLIEGMKSDQHQRRLYALKALGYFKVPYAEKGLVQLEAAIQDKDSEIASAAAYSLGNIGEPAFLILQKCLKAEDDTVRFYGLYGFRIAGPKAVSQVRNILPLLGDEISSVRRQALIALDNIQYFDKELVPYLEKMLQDEDEWIRRDAENLLERIK